MDLVSEIGFNKVSMKTNLKEEQTAAAFNISQILKPKTAEEVTEEIKRRLKGKDLDTLKETDKYVIYQIKSGKDIQDIIRNFGGRDEDIFFNFYLILDNSTTGEKQILGIKVSPDGSKTIMDAKGHNIEESYLQRFN